MFGRIGLAHDREHVRLREQREDQPGHQERPEGDVGSHPDAPHGGWGPPGPLDFVVLTRIAGGAIARGDGEPDGVTGGIEIWAGPRLGAVAITFGGALLGAGAFGSELRLHLVENEVLSLALIGGYGWYWLAGGLGIGVGHGPRFGLDLAFAAGTGEDGPY